MSDYLHAVSEDTGKSAATVEAEYEAVLSRYGGNEALAATEFAETVADWKAEAVAVNP